MRIRTRFKTKIIIRIETRMRTRLRIRTRIITRIRTRMRTRMGKRIEIRIGMRTRMGIIMIIRRIRITCFSHKVISLFSAGVCFHYSDKFVFCKLRQHKNNGFGVNNDWWVLSFIQINLFLPYERRRTGSGKRVKIKITYFSY